MLLKPSEELFKFPVRIFDPVEMEEEDYTSEITSRPPDRSVREYVVAWKRVPIETITDWGESFSKGRTLYDVKQNGFDATLVYLGNDSYICDWEMTVFEKEYNKHFRRLMKQNKELAEEDFIQEINAEELIKQLQNTQQNG